MSAQANRLAHESREEHEHRIDSRRLGALFLLWSVVGLVTLTGTIGPALAQAATFAGGYYKGNDYPIDAILSALLLATFVGFFALANTLFRLGILWRLFFYAFGIHAVCAFAGQAILSVTFESIVQTCVANAQRSVDAIHAFESERGRAPRSLRELAPQYLPVDPTWVHEGTVLWYELTSSKDPPPVGAWKIKPNFLEDIGLEYAPGAVERELAPHERRIGDWIVDARGP